MRIRRSSKIFAVLGISVLYLTAGCMNSTPSTILKPQQIPSPSQPSIPSMPAPGSSSPPLPSELPSDGQQPPSGASNDGSVSSLPVPALPAPESPSPVPRSPSSSVPSSDPTTIPDLLGMPKPGSEDPVSQSDREDNNNSRSSDRDTGNGTSDSNRHPDDSLPSRDGETVQEKSPSSQKPESGFPSDESSQDNDGWETSNGIPTSVEQTSKPNEPKAGGRPRHPTEQTSDKGTDELEHTLGGLDAEIMNERRESINRINESAARSALPRESEAPPNTSIPSQPAQSVENHAEKSSGEENDTEIKEGILARRGATPKHQAIPPDLPDAKDDDIVARQLREAAMAEVDPILKEKLWEEYRRYTSRRRQ